MNFEAALLMNNCILYGYEEAGRLVSRYTLSSNADRTADAG